MFCILIKGKVCFLIYLTRNFYRVTISELLCVLWHIFPLSFSKTYSHTLTVYTQAWITINPCSGEGVYGVPAVQGLMLRCKVLFLWSHLWVSEPKGLPLLIKVIKYTLVLAGVRGFENHSPDDVRDFSTEYDTVSSSSRARAVRSCLLTPCEPGTGRRPWEERDGEPSGHPIAGMLLM